MQGVTAGGPESGTETGSAFKVGAETGASSAGANAAAPVIAIDGPSGTGKGTLRTRVAGALGFHMLDSGALYRALAWWVAHQGLDPADEVEVARCAACLPIRFCADDSELGVRIIVAGHEVTEDLRGEDVGAQASVLAARPAVRAGLLELQHGFRRPPGLVADGRDMGTVVFPNADVKIYLTASPEVRAERRHKQLNEKGAGVSLATLVAEIAARDARDTGRSVAPLKPAADAFILDTSTMNVDAVFAEVMARVSEAGVAAAKA